MKFFDAVVSRVVPYGLSSVAVTGTQFFDLDRVQRRMLRSIVGWRRPADDEGSDTMRRMTARVALAMHQYLGPDWTQQLKRRKLILVTNLTTQPGWLAQCIKLPSFQDWEPGRMTRWYDDCTFIHVEPLKLYGH